AGWTWPRCSGATPAPCPAETRCTPPCGAHRTRSRSWYPGLKPLLLPHLGGHQPTGVRGRSRNVVLGLLLDFLTVDGAVGIPVDAPDFPVLGDDTHRGRLHHPIGNHVIRNRNAGDMITNRSEEHTSELQS